MDKETRRHRNGYVKTFGYKEYKCDKGNEPIRYLYTAFLMLEYLEVYQNAGNQSEKKTQYKYAVHRYLPSLVTF